MGAPSTPSVESLIGRRGRLIGSHPWAGHSGEIVRVENFTPAGLAGAGSAARQEK